MGKLKQGILGGVSGKVGGVVGTSWKGIAVVKAMPLSVANPRTAAQVGQRTSMSNVVAFSTQVLASVIKPLNDRFAVKMSGFNAFVSRNIGLFSTASPSPASSLALAVGKMAAVVPSSVNYSGSEYEVTVTWPTTLPDGYAQATDKAYLVAVRDGNLEVAAHSGIALRSAGTAILSFDTEAEVGGLCHVWLAFLRADGTVVSNTGYKFDVM